MATIQKLDNTLADDLLSLRKQVQAVEFARADDRREIRKVQAEIAQLKNQYTAQARLQEDRMNTMAAQLAAISNTLRGGDAQNTGTTRDGQSSPVTDTLGAYERLDHIIKDLAAQVERASDLQIHGAKVACHCEHATINSKIAKLSKRLTQVRGVVFDSCADKS